MDHPTLALWMLSDLRRLTLAAWVGVGGCTYGTPETVVTVEQVVRLGDSYRALVLVRLDTYERPTGLNTFPDGGRWRYVARGATQHLIDAASGEVTALARQSAPDEVWESFGARIAGIEGDSVAYVRLTGCPRGGECHPTLSRSLAYRLTTRGDFTPVEIVPAGAGLPGEMLARRPGEESYVRFSPQEDAVTARFEEDGSPLALFVAGPDGALHPVGR